MTDSQSALHLVNQASAIAQRYIEIAEVTGENYNVFNVLGLTSAENYHSAFLADLLNPSGLHGMGSVFLELFILQTVLSKITDKQIGFDASSAKVRTEYHVGFKNKDQTEGGRIDIWLEDKGQMRILIENKIYAEDQYRQLVRYRNYDRNALLLYLNLEGTSAKEHSTSNDEGKVVAGTDYHCVSYTKDITAWLEACLKEVVAKPLLRETLQQYLFLVKQLTNQSTNAKMENELIELFGKNPENYSLALQLNQAAYQAKIRAFKLITQELNNLVTLTNESLKAQIKGEFYIRVGWRSDANDPIYWFFVAVKDLDYDFDFGEKVDDDFKEFQDYIRKKYWLEKHPERLKKYSHLFDERKPNVLWDRGLFWRYEPLLENCYLYKGEIIGDNKIIEEQFKLFLNETNRKALVEKLNSEITADAAALMVLFNDIQ